MDCSVSGRPTRASAVFTGGKSLSAAKHRREKAGAVGSEGVAGTSRADRGRASDAVPTRGCIRYNDIRERETLVWLHR
jgi:hypothetical protein